MSNLSRSGARGLSVVPASMADDGGAVRERSLPTQVSGLPQCVGRDAELARARALYDRACSEGNGRLLLVIGGEKRGIARAVEEAADWRVSIPYGREVGYALGAAPAAAILSFEILRQRRMKS